ncbi:MULTISPECIES: DUF5723 family protein [unclassified Carboxylicivirga]|uniref:DUF5723 family protein n=1 Tax=Carboxylicivirga TaxID=1628153 RepID=UPI003D3324AF
MKYLYSLIMALAMVFTARAQDNTLMFTKGIPQAAQMNAAFRPVNNWYIAMPALGSVQFKGANSGFSWSDIIREGTGLQRDSLIIDLDYAAAQMKDNNLLATEASLQVLGFGFAARHWFFTVDVNHKFKAQVNYPLSLMDLRYGNWDYDTQKPINHSLSDMHVNGLDYHELALGISREITERLTLGLRVKYLIGVANVESEYLTLDMETFENGDMRLIADAAFRTNVPLDVIYDAEGYVDELSVSDSAEDLLSSTSNTGWGFDVGLTYRLGNKLTLGAAVNDLGFINWKEGTSRLYTQGSFDYNGVDVSDELTGDEGDADYLDQLADDFKETFRFSNDESSYKTNLMGNFNVSADYQPAKWINLGLVSKNYFVNDQVVPELTVAAGLRAGRFLSTAISYSYMKNAPANLGAGLALNFGALQVYGATDNLNAALKPSTAKYVNARVGINFVFNRPWIEEEASEETSWE